MALGSVQSLVVCVSVDAPVSAQQQAVCPVVNGQYQAPANMQAYVIDPAQQGYFETLTKPFDYAHASMMFASSFTLVVGLYYVSAGIGAVLNAIRGRG